MPRSGTTLCELILAAHAETYAAGRRSALRRSFAALGGPEDNAAAVARVAAATRQVLDAAAMQYLADLHAIAPDKKRILDKMPANYLHMGIAYAAESKKVMPLARARSA